MLPFELNNLGARRYIGYKFEKDGVIQVRVVIFFQVSSEM
jgi:hypothetical protein